MNISPSVRYATRKPPALPCDSTELVKFRQRIGKGGVEKIFAMSIALHGKRMLRRKK